MAVELILALVGIGAAILSVQVTLRRIAKSLEIIEECLRTMNWERGP
jgi:hypothetical protein